MDALEIKRLIEWLQNRVSYREAEGGIIIEFDEPSAADFIAEGFDREAVDLTLESSWWPEMIADIRETPEFAGPDETDDQIILYAGDVVKEYVNKRIL